MPDHPRSTRRRRLAAAAAGTAVVVLAASTTMGVIPTAVAAGNSSRPASPTTLPGGLSLATASIAQLQAGLSAGTFTSVELVNGYLARIEAVNYAGPRLNAIRELSSDALVQAKAADAARAAGQARGQLFGIPLLIKDNVDVAGLPTTAGSVALAGSVPRGDAPLTASLRAAGAIVLGKTNLTEFANYLTGGMPAGYSSLGGQVLNAYDLSQTPSGSSAGSGVAASVALAAGTVGTETSGSIISPANANALVGIKPTVGLISRTGVIPISGTQDTAGPMTRYVGDAAAILTGLATGADPEDPATQDGVSESFDAVDYTASLSSTALQGVRLGYLPATSSDANVVAAYQAGLAALRAQGATLVEVTAPVNTTARGILDREFKRDLNAYLARLGPNAPVKTLAEVIAYNNAHSDVALKFGQTLALAAQAVDLADPATNAAYQADRTRGLTETRAAIDNTLSANDVQAIVSNAATTGIGARAGYPSLTMPAGFAANNRRPVPITFLGTAYSEQRLIAYASDLEAATQVWRSPESLNPTAFACTPLALPNSAASCDRPVTKARTTTVVSAVRNPVRVGARATLKIVVAAAAARPTGRLVARSGGTKVGTGVAGKGGRDRIRIKALKPGLRKVTVTYQGDATTLRSKGAVFVRVVRRR